MKTNHDGTVTLNAYDTWISCGACGQRVTGDSVHTCSPQFKELTDEEIMELIPSSDSYDTYLSKEDFVDFARAILRKAQESCNGFCGEYECKENKARCKRKAQEK